MKLIKNFFAIDGPNGVGKSTVIEKIKQQVSEYQLACVFTKEPTNSSLGNFIRQNQDVYVRHTLAALVAADRYNHIERLILPEISAGSIVITDRYLASSFVYQVQDGVDYKFITNLNSEVILPSCYFILRASEQTIAERLGLREGLTRFESTGSSNREADLFQKSGELLKALGVTVYFLDNDYASSEETAKAILKLVVQHKEDYTTAI